LSHWKSSLMQFILMNNESLRRHLAEKVMGWRETSQTEPALYWDRIKQVVGSVVDEWKPDENLLQAFECLDTFNEGYEIFVEGDVKKVTVYTSAFETTEVYAREEAGGSLPMAISLACGRATGFNED